MTQTLHIFRKDVRHLALFILIVAGLQTVLAISQVRAVQVFSDRPQIIQFLVAFLLPFAWIFLVALLVLQEPMTGENSFWVTRPYSRRRLLIAKFLFILAFLNLPLFLSDCFILHTLHLPVSIGQLVLRQLPLFTVIIVPAFALACASRNISQFSLFCVLFLLAFFLQGQLFDEPVQTKNYDLFLILLPFACLAFLAARWPLVASVFILLPVTLFTTHLLHGQAHLIGPPRVPTQTDTPEISFAGPIIATTLRNGTAYEIRLAVRDVLPDTVLYGVADNGPNHITLEKDPGGYCLHFTGRPPNGSFHALLDTWVLNDKATYTTKLNATQPFLVSSLGICRASLNPAPFQCWAGPRMLRSARVTARGAVPVILDRYFWQDSLLWGFTPTASFTLGDSNWTKLPPDTAVDFTPLFPMAHFALPVSGNITLPR